MNIAFTGHRNVQCNQQVLVRIAQKYPLAVWIHGGAKGFDSQVAAAAKEFGIEQVVILPDYKSYSSKLAPIIRNKEIVNMANVLVACYDGRENGGTYQTICYAKQKQVKLFIVAPIALPHIATP